MAILDELRKVEQGILDAVGELGDAAGDAVVGALKAAAGTVHDVIGAVAGENKEG